MSKLVGRAIGGVMNPVLHEVDVNDILQRVEINDLLNRVDVNSLLDRVDLNQQMERVDMDRLLKRVDINKLIERSNLEAIVARSSYGLFSHMLDIVRDKAILADQTLHDRLGRCRCLYPLCCRPRPPVFLPPKPGPAAKGRGDTATGKEPPYPRTMVELAVVIQGRHAGFVSRACAYAVDFGILILLLSILSLLVEALHGLVDPKAGLGWEESWNAEIWVPLFVYAFYVLYVTLSLALVGRTIGKAVMGLLVVSTSGRRITLSQAFLRGLIASIPTLVALTSVPGIPRRNRRGLQDLVSCSCVIYAWDARDMQLRAKALSKSQYARELPTFDDGYDIQV